MDDIENCKTESIVSTHTAIPHEENNTLRSLSFLVFDIQSISRGTQLENYPKMSILQNS